MNKKPGRKPRQKLLPAPKNKELPVQTTMNLDPQALITAAIQQGGSLEMLDKLVTLGERLQAKIAEKAYREAMSAFQTECPIVEKKKIVRNKPAEGSTKPGIERYRYAPIEDIADAIKPYLEKNGLSFKIETTITLDPPGIDAVVRVYHALGHCEDSKFWVPTDRDAHMTEPQKWASAATFASRNALKNALGVFSRGEDTNTEPTKTSKTTKEIEEMFKNAQNKIDSSQTVEQLTKRGNEIRDISEHMTEEKHKILSSDYSRRMKELMEIAKK